jgi:hypothetical protein
LPPPHHAITPTARAQVALSEFDKIPISCLKFNTPKDVYDRLNAVAAQVRL